MFREILYHQYDESVKKQIKRSNSSFENVNPDEVTTHKKTFGGTFPYNVVHYKNFKKVTSKRCLIWRVSPVQNSPFSSKLELQEISLDQEDLENSTMTIEFDSLVLPTPIFATNHSVSDESDSDGPIFIYVVTLSKFLHTIQIPKRIFGRDDKLQYKKSILSGLFSHFENLHQSKSFLGASGSHLHVVSPINDETIACGFSNGEIVLLYPNETDPDEFEVELNSRSKFISFFSSIFSKTENFKVLSFERISSELNGDVLLALKENSILDFYSLETLALIESVDLSSLGKNAKCHGMRLHSEKDSCVTLVCHLVHSEGTRTYSTFELLEFSLVAKSIEMGTIASKIIHQNGYLDDFYLEGNNIYTLWSKEDKKFAFFGDFADLQVQALHGQPLPMPAWTEIHLASKFVEFPFSGQVIITPETENHILDLLCDLTIFPSEIIDNALGSSSSNQQVRIRLEDWVNQQMDTHPEMNNKILFEIWSDLWKKCKREWNKSFSAISFGSVARGSVGLIHTTGMSILRTLDVMEHLSLSNNALFLNRSQHSLPSTEIKELLGLVSLIKQFADIFSPNPNPNPNPEEVEEVFWISVQNYLFYNLESKDIFSTIKYEKMKPFLGHLLENQDLVPNHADSIQLLISLSESFVDKATDQLVGFQVFFSSYLTIASLKQIVSTRFTFSCHFLFFLFFLTKYYPLESSLKKKLDTKLIPRLVFHNKMYSVHHWLLTKHNQYSIQMMHYLEKKNVFTLSALSSNDSLSAWSNHGLFNALVALESIWYENPKQRLASLEFANFLFQNDCYVILEEFSRLLIPHISYLLHYLGLAYYHKLQFDKALDAFKTAAFVIGHNTQAAKLFGINKEINGELVYYYYDKLRQITEKNTSLQLEFSQLALELAPDEKERSNLYSIIFSCQVKFERFTEAYLCIVANQDVQRKMNDLKRFLDVIQDTGNWWILIEFPFLGMLGDVDAILSTRARSCDVTAKPHLYEILYSFHTYRGSWSYAARNMYLFAKRIEQESNSLDMLVRKSQALLACKNALEFVDKNQQCVLFVEEEAKVVTLKQIEQEYWYDHARIELSKIKGSLMTALCFKELIGSCADFGLFDIAFTLAKYLEPHESLGHHLKIFESLTKRTIGCRRENWIFVTEIFSDATGEALGWKLLDKYLKQYNRPENLAKVIETMLALNVADDDEKLVGLMDRLTREGPNDLLQVLSKNGKWNRAEKMINQVGVTKVYLSPMLVKNVMQKLPNHNLDWFEQ